MLFELLISTVLHGNIDNSELTPREPIIDTGMLLKIKGPDFNVYEIKEKDIPELPISLQERKELFIKELPRGCFWHDTITFILLSDPKHWKTRWQRAQRIDYQPFMGYGLVWRKKSELREIVKLAKKFGIELE